MLPMLPIGTDDFKKVITGGYYYVDKTMLVQELLDKRGEVNLFTRPRRFGKTLNMSMLQYFFEDTGKEEENRKNKSLFANLAISHMEETCRTHQNHYPVISLTLKSAKQPTWELAYACIKEAIGMEFRRHRFVMEVLELEEERRRYYALMNQSGEDRDYVTALQFLSSCLYQYFQKPVLILIDEYDVPLENAYFSGFYQQMAAFIRSLLESALKSNPCLAFAVITGCLRITRESIFTGLNNMEMVSILNDSYEEYFGFTEKEMKRILTQYGLEKHGDTLRRWYDGYRFGSVQVYNPWSVANYVKALTVNPDALPSPYWANTSSNDIVRRLVEGADLMVKSQLEELMQGGSIEKSVHEDITYGSVDESQDNLWNFLFFTGYLRQESQRLDGRNRMVRLSIPNEEVAYIYENTISGWFKDMVRTRDLSTMYRAMLSGDGEIFQKELSRLLQESISYMDNGEAFYHGFLLGALGGLSDYLVKSNRESGDGRPDIQIRHVDVSQGAVILELKACSTYSQLRPAAEEALAQIRDRAYDRELREEGYERILHYGIAFFRKQCLILPTRSPADPKAPSAPGLSG